MTPVSRRSIRLVIIHHESEPYRRGKKYFISAVIPFWRERGVEVLETRGTRNAPGGDIALLHVDLSVTPPEYLDLAAKYPVCLNKGIGDIRKSNFNPLRIGLNSDYEGRVIVKSALNCAGIPEAAARYTPLKRLRRWGEKLVGMRASFRFPSKKDYRIYDSVLEVPPHVWESNLWIVEKFRPELHHGKYCLREWYFLGKQSMVRAELSTEPVFTSGTHAPELQQPVPKNLEAIRKQLGFDYGKFDFTVVDGEAIPFDFNKTMGVSNPSNPAVQEMAKQLAGGIEPYL